MKSIHEAAARLADQPVMTSTLVSTDLDVHTHDAEHLEDLLGEMRLRHPGLHVRPSETLTNGSTSVPQVRIAGNRYVVMRALHEEWGIRAADAMNYVGPA